MRERGRGARGREAGDESWGKGTLDVHQSATDPPAQNAVTVQPGPGSFTRSPSSGHRERERERAFICNFP
jgi:hypothetical protein